MLCNHTVDVLGGGQVHRATEILNDWAQPDSGKLWISLWDAYLLLAGKFIDSAIGLLRGEAGGVAMVTGTGGCGSLEAMM